jgi:hypothetical protein
MSIQLRTKPGSYTITEQDPVFADYLEPGASFTVECRSVSRTAMSAIQAAHADDDGNALVADLLFARIQSWEGFVDSDGTPIPFDRVHYDLMCEWNPGFIRALSSAALRKENVIRAGVEAARRD